MLSIDTQRIYILLLFYWWTGSFSRIKIGQKVMDKIWVGILRSQR